MRMVAVLALVLAFNSLGEETAELRAKGVAALRESQTNPKAVIEAARNFVAAADGLAADDERAQELNAYIYWCAKKLSAEEVEALRKSGLAAVAEKLGEVSKLAPKADEVQEWNERAEKFAAANANEHLLVSVRFFEVADRFKGTDASLAAQERSLKEMQLSMKAEEKKAAIPAKVVRPPVEKVTVPTAERQKEVETVLHDLFKAEFLKTAPAEKLEFAKQLGLLATQSPDPAEKYVQLREARDLALAAGDLSSSLQQIGKLGEIFSINEVEEKINFLQGVNEKNKNRALFKPLALAAAGLIEEAFAADLMAKVPVLIQTADKAATASDEKPLAAEIHAKMAIANANLRECTAAQGAIVKLKATPDDPALNLQAGRFLCFIRADWESGVVLLAKGSDAGLKKAALNEQGAKGDAAAIATAATGWWELGDKLLPDQKKAAQIHAAKLYEEALPELSGAAKMLADKRMAMAGMLRPGKGGGKTHDLIAAFDGERDYMVDRWTKLDGTLTSANSGLLRIAQFPFHPAAEYDWRVVFERVSGTGPVNLNFLWNHSLQMLSLGASANTVSGFSHEDDKWDPTINKNTVKFDIQNRRKYEVVLKVRKDGYGFSVDGETKIETQTRGDKVKAPGKYRMKDFDALGASCEDLVIFHTLEVTDITGNGELTTDVKYSNRSGTAMGSAFKEMWKDRVLTGMKLYWDGGETTSLYGIQAIYSSPQGRVEGKLNGTTKGKEYVVEARPGYAVGDMQVYTAGSSVRAILLTFNKLKGDKIEATEKYEGQWVGGRKGASESKVARRGPFFGIYGTLGGAPDTKPNSIGVMGKY